MTLESALIPIPSEITMPFAGYLASQGHVNFFLIVFVGAVGNLVGSLLSYALGFYLEESIILSLIKKYGKFVLVSESDYKLAVQWLRKYGNPVAFFSRLLPAVRTFISLPAGLSEMNIFQFSVYTFLGSLIWSTILTGIGFYLGSKWDTIHPYFQKFQFAIVFLLIIAVLLFINHKLKIVKFNK